MLRNFPDPLHAAVFHFCVGIQPLCDRFGNDGALVFFKDFFGQMPVAAAVFGGGAGADLFKFRVLAEGVGERMLIAPAGADDAENFGDSVKILPVAREWQNRPLDEVYPVIYIDAIHYSVKDNGVIRKMAAYVILGISCDGRKDVLTIEVGENESSKYWLSVLNSLKNRGVKDILIICADGLSGIRDAIQTAYPMTEYQRCIVHQVRNTLKYVSDKDRKAFAKDLKTIYNAPNEEQGRINRDQVTEKWSEKYPNAMKRWERDWDVITPIFKFSSDVRTVIYTTNAIESLNSTYRKLNRQRSVFPSDQAILKALYLATFEATKKWTAQIVLHELDHLEGVII